MTHDKKDHTFKLLVEDKKIFLRFLNHFEPEMGTLTLEDLSSEKTDFIDLDLGETRRDVLYRVRCQGREVFVYVLLEHQSSVDYSMSYRMARYVIKIHEKYVNDHKLSGKRKDFHLPSILPIVYYDAEEEWDASLNLKGLMEPVEKLEDYYLQLKYKIIRLNDIPERTLKKLNNVLGVYMMLTHPKMQDKYREKLFKLS
jgi:predicted transposase/invertase (TIGR01784 family)